MIAFIDDHRDAYGFEPICKVLPIAPSTYREHVARRRDQIHRAPSRGEHRTLGRQRRRFLRQRARRDHRRPLQGRGHSSARAVVLVRGGRVRHARMGGMVQQQKAAGAGRKHSSGRSRSPLPCAIRCARQGGLTQNKLPPEKPGRFIAFGAATLLSPDSPSDGAKDEADPDDCCEPLYRDIDRQVGIVKQRYSDMRRDDGDFYNDRPTGRMSWASHQQQYRQDQKILRDLLNEADAKGCKNYRPDAWK